MKGKSAIAVRIGILPTASVAICYRCDWDGGDGLWRFRWDVNGRTRRSELAFPGDHGFPTFHDAMRAAVELGFRVHNIVMEAASWQTNASF